MSGPKARPLSIRLDVRRFLGQGLRRRRLPLDDVLRRGQGRVDPPAPRAVLNSGMPGDSRRGCQIDSLTGINLVEKFDGAGFSGW